MRHIPKRSSTACTEDSENKKGHDSNGHGKLNPTRAEAVLIAAGMTLLFLLLATGALAFVIPIVGAAEGYYYWQAKSVR